MHMPPPFLYQHNPSRESIICGKVGDWFTERALIMLKFLPKTRQKAVMPHIRPWVTARKARALTAASARGCQAFCRIHSVSLPMAIGVLLKHARVAFAYIFLPLFVAGYDWWFEVPLGFLWFCWWYIQQYTKSAQALPTDLGLNWFMRFDIWQKSTLHRELLCSWLWRPLLKVPYFEKRFDGKLFVARGLADAESRSFATHIKFYLHLKKKICSFAYCNQCAQ